MIIWVRRVCDVGEGKTRVILPMLILYWAGNGGQKHILRLNLLSTLLGEAFQYMHNTLCASVHLCKLFLQVGWLIVESAKRYSHKQPLHVNKLHTFFDNFQ